MYTPLAVLLVLFPGVAYSLALLFLPTLYLSIRAAMPSSFGDHDHTLRTRMVNVQSMFSRVDGSCNGLFVPLHLCHFHHPSTGFFPIRN
ncbi:MAG: hypothetical protein J3Q66DRAFT_343313 [Benniella sp.]|nr:MAG: hypothetical protein J3Q66DRAFT_343313 [Benniella sp.]